MKFGVQTCLVWILFFLLWGIAPIASYAFSKEEWTKQHQSIVLLAVDRKFQDALPLALANLARAKEYFGKSDPQTSTSANLTVQIYTALGQNSKANAIQQEYFTALPTEASSLKKSLRQQALKEFGQSDSYRDLLGDKLETLAEQLRSLGANKQAEELLRIPEDRNNIESSPSKPSKNTHITEHLKGVQRNDLTSKVEESLNKFLRKRKKRAEERNEKPSKEINLSSALGQKHSESQGSGNPEKSIPQIDNLESFKKSLERAKGSGEGMKGLTEKLNLFQGIQAAVANKEFSTQIGKELIQEKHPKMARVMEGALPSNTEKQIRALLKKGQFFKALPLAEKATAERMPTDLLWSFNLSSLAKIYSRLALFEKSQQVYQLLDEEHGSSKSFEVLTKLNPQPGHPQMVEQNKRLLSDFSKLENKRNLAKNFIAMGKYKEAEQVFKKVLEKIGSLPEGMENYTLAIRLELGNLYHAIGQYSKARKTYNWAQSFFQENEKKKKNMPKNSREMGKAVEKSDLAALTKISGSQPLPPSLIDLVDAQILYQMVNLFRSLGEYEKAINLQKRILSTWNKENALDNSQRLYHDLRLADLYGRTGQYAEARSLFKNLLSDMDEKLSTQVSPNGDEIPLERHPDDARTKVHYARLMQDTGGFNLALSAQVEAKGIQEDSLGMDHPDIAQTLLEMGDSYHELAGKENQHNTFSQKAEKAFFDANTIIEKRLGANHPTLSLGLVKLGQLHYEQGKFDLALSEYQRALRIREDKYTPIHLDIAEILTQMGKLFREKGQALQARNHFIRAVDIRKKVHGIHPEVGVSLGNVAETYLLEEQWKKAKVLYQEALGIFEQAGFEDHPGVATIFVGLSRLAVLQENFKEAFEHLQKAIKIEERHIHAQVGIAREEKQLQLMKKWNTTYYLVLNLVRQHLSKDPVAMQQALDLVLARKALVLDDKAKVMMGLDPEAQDRLRNYRQRINSLLNHPPPEMTSDQLHDARVKAQSDLETLETKIALRNPRFSARQTEERANTDQLVQILPPQSVLLEFVKFPIVDWRSLSSIEEEAFYLAFVVKPGQEISLVDLGKSVQMEKNIRGFRSSIQVGDPDTILKKTKYLYKAVWYPLEKHIGDATLLILSPDGLLNLVQFAALRSSSDSQFLIEQTGIVFVSSGRDVMRQPSDQSQSNGHLSIWGDPDFYGEAVQTFEAMKEYPSYGSSPCSDPEDKHNQAKFKCLKSTRKEVRDISNLFPKSDQSLHLGLAAQEVAFREQFTSKDNQPPKILHMATHGFFNINYGADLDFSGNGSFQIEEDTIYDFIGSPVDNMLLRSGLALVGANVQQQASSSMDGLVSAYEISGMNFHGTDLVVLSACDTGVGDIQAGEGVFGLRRVFAQNGAKNLVMSLWPVADKEARKLMKIFYKYYHQGMHPASALRKAQLERITRLRRDWGSASPSLWAPFVVQSSETPYAFLPNTISQ